MAVCRWPGLARSAGFKRRTVRPERTILQAGRFSLVYVLLYASALPLFCKVSMRE